MKKNNKKDYSKLSKEELVAKINKLLEEKKYGLVWEDKEENVVKQCQKELPVLEEVKNKEIITDSEKPINLLIEGDNYHSLSVLNYTHERRVDVIYIDPPYNTGKTKEFKYNDKWVDINDGYRHSKWVAFIEKRLKLAKDLLKNTGIIYVSIDDNEVAQLKLLMDQIFGENNKIGIFTVETPNQTADANKIKNADFLLVYSKSQRARFKLPFKKQVARCTTGKENQTQPIIEFPKGLKVIGVKDGIYKDTRKTGGNEDIFIIKGPIIIKSGKLAQSIKLKARWANPNDIKRYINKFTSKSKNPVFNKFGKELIDLYLQGNRFQPQMIKRGFAIPHTILLGFTQKGGDLLRNILHRETLRYPKHPAYIKYLLSISNNKNSTILDFMAGSGTTAQAVLELNKEDNGNRQFILCTNNENKICTNVCYPRIKKVIKGYKDLKGEKIKGLGGNFKYYKTNFVSKSRVSDDTKYGLVQRSTEMICIKEDTFDEVLNKKYIKIFRNKNQYTAILFHLDYFDDFKKELRKLNKPIHIYVFSLTNDTYENDFKDLKQKFDLCPIPESILEVYRKIFKE